MTPEEHKLAEQAVEITGKLVEDFVDIGKLAELSRTMEPLNRMINIESAGNISKTRYRIGWFCSSAFTFYYPENLDDLQVQNCELIRINPVEDEILPNIDALYIGGGFPETHASSLADNLRFIDSVANAARNGLPIWAECGGLVFLARNLEWQERIYPMAGVLPVDVKVHNRPQGHGYQQVVVDTENSFLPVGTKIKGHEFHYSQVTSTKGVETAMKVERGVGIGDGRDGILAYNTLASYLHIHSLASPEWCRGVLNSALNYSVSPTQY